MLREMPAAQFSAWILFAEIEPFGELRDDYRMANMMQLMANMNRNVKKRPEPFTLEDFMLDWDGSRAERQRMEEVSRRQAAKTPADMLRIARLWAAVYNPPGTNNDGTPRPIGGSDTPSPELDGPENRPSGS